MSFSFDSSPVKRDRQAILDEVGMNDQLRFQIERLISARAKDFRLQGKLAELWAEFSWRNRRRAATDWLIGSTLIDLGAIGIDYLIEPSLLWSSLFIRGVCIPLLLLFTLRIWKCPTAVRTQGLTTVTFLISIMATAGVLGAMAGGRTYERYIFAGFVGVASAIPIVPVRFIWTLLSAAAICVAYLFLQILDTATPFRGSALIGVYLIGVCAALVMTRRAITVMQQRVVLLHFRDTFRVRDLAAANALLAYKASTDELTGLMNRRSLMEALDRHAARLVRISLLMLDIDHFKRLNDSFGHAEGDRCLALVGSTIACSVRTRLACSARYGGEEFAVVLPDIDAKHASLIADDLRAAIEALRLPNSILGDERVVTVSIGVSTIEISESTGEFTVARLMRQADDALYNAKRGGRNRVCTYSSVASFEDPSQH